MNDLHDRMPELLCRELGEASEASRPLDLSEVLHNGRRQRRLRHARRGAALGVMIAAAVGTVPLLDSALAPRASSTAAPADAATVPQAPTPTANASLPVPGPRHVTTDAVLSRLRDVVSASIAPATWTVESESHLDDFYTVDGNVDPGDGKPARLFVMLWPQPRPSGGLSCNDPEYVAGGTCTYSALPGGGSMSVTSHPNGPRGLTIQVDVSTSTGSGASVEVDNGRTTAAHLPAVMPIVRNDTPLDERQAVALAKSITAALAAS